MGDDPKIFIWQYFYGSSPEKIQQLQNSNHPMSRFIISDLFDFLFVFRIQGMVGWANPGN